MAARMFPRVEVRLVNELWSIRTGAHKHGWTVWKRARAGAIVVWLAARENRVKLAARKPRRLGGGWDRKVGAAATRATRFQLLHRARLRIKKGGHPDDYAEGHDNTGAAAVKAGLSMVGKTETGWNDAPWLRSMETTLVKAGFNLGWMIPGQPYCGFGCIWSWWVGAHDRLPDGTVFTPNICPWGGKQMRGLRFTRVAPEDAKLGALVVCNFGSGGAKHVALARGPMVGGSIPTVEFNTSPGAGGSQANGDGCWKRSRSRGLILCVVNVEEVA